MSFDTRVEVLERYIDICTDFRSLFVCRQIPGARWNARKRSWAAPATPITAKIILRAFPGLTDPALLALAARPPQRRTPPPLPQAQPPAPPPPPEIPNLRTRPWKHQVLAYNFVLDALARHGGTLLAMGMGTGKSLVAVAAACNLEVSLILVICPARVVDVLA